MKRQYVLSLIVFAVTISIWMCWSTIVWLYQAGWLPVYGETSGQLERAGQFGDAFGVLASLMTALAAAAALSAFWGQRREVRLQEFERNFFTLLENLQTHIQQIDVRRLPDDELAKLDVSIPYEQDPNGLMIAHNVSSMSPISVVQGRDALRSMLSGLRVEIFYEENFKDSKLIHRFYGNFYNYWNDDLGHYFRTLYHIFRLISEECPSDPMRYARIARSHLSSSEIILLAYNCSVGEGRHKFKELVNKFSLLNNYHLDDNGSFFLKEMKFFERHIGLGAFGDRQQDDFEY